MKSSIGVFLVLALVVTMYLVRPSTRSIDRYEPYQHQTIPRRLWQTYKTKDLPNKARECQQTWLDHFSDFEYTLTDDGDIAQLIASHFDAATNAAFRTLPLGVMKADLWRYCVLYVHGGVYSDIDSVAMQPYAAWNVQPEHKVIIGLENDTHFCQWTIASVPRHPMFKKLIRIIVDQIEHGIDTSSEHFVHRYTGPGVWTRAIHEFLGYPIEQRARYTYTLYQTDPEHRKKINERGIRLEDRPFFSKQMVKNLFGSTQFHDGYTSWTDTRDQLIRDHRNKSSL